MARGGKGGNRGGSRGRGAAGFPANAQGTRTSQAQSGGIANSFQGTAGGGRAFGNKGGSAGLKDVASGTLNTGTTYRVRSPGGDTTLIKGGLKGAGRLNLPGGADYKGTSGPTNQSIVKPHELAPKGFGGGY